TTSFRSSSLTSPKRQRGPPSLALRASEKTASKRGVAPMRRFLQQITIRRIAVLILLTSSAAWLWAHEGHQALPTRGASVDLDKGLVILSPQARQALGIATAEVRLEPLDERWTAPAAVETTWRGHAFATTRLAGKIAALHVQPGQDVTA